MNRQASKNYKIMILITSIFLITRVLLILFSPHIFHPEEVKEATLGIDLIKGKLHLPFWAYIDSPHAGGSIFVALAKIPFYLIFGQNYLAVKLTALFISLLFFLFIIWFMCQVYDKAILLPLSILLIFPPPQFLIFSQYNIGNITEPLLFVFINLYLIHEIFIRKQRNNKNLLLLGAASGFGLWLHPLGLTVLATLFLVWFLKEGWFFLRKQFLYFAAAFLFGSSPFLIYNLLYDLASFNSDQVIDSSIFVQSPIESLIKLKNLILVYLPHSFQIQDVALLQAKQTSWLIYGIFLASIMYFIYRALRAKRREFNLELLIIFYFFVSLFIMAFTKTLVGATLLKWGSIDSYKFYYLFFFQPIFLVITIITITHTTKSKHKLIKLMGASILTILTVILTLNYFKLISLKKANDQLLQPIYDIGANAYEAGFSHARNRAFFKIYNSIDDDLKQSFLQGSGANWHYYLKDKTLSLRLTNLLRKQLSTLSLNEREIFLKWILEGEWKSIPGTERDIWTIKNIYDYLLTVLDGQDELILKRTIQKLDL